MIAAEQKTSLEKKIEKFREICEQAPGDLTPILALGEASLRRGLRLEALKAFQQVTKSQDAVSEAHLAIAQIFGQQRMVGEAYEEIGRVLEWEPDNVEARLLARELSLSQEPPSYIADFLASIPPFGAIEKARGRLRVLQRLVEREFQERTRNASLEPGEPLQEYHVEEARRRLDHLNRQLEALEELEEETRRRQLEPPTADLVPPQAFDAPQESAYRDEEAGPDLDLYPEVDEEPSLSFGEAPVPVSEFGESEPPPASESFEPLYEPAPYQETSGLDVEASYEAMEVPEVEPEFEPLPEHQPPGPAPAGLELDFSDQSVPDLDLEPDFRAASESASSLELDVPGPPSLEPDFDLPEPVADLEPEFSLSSAEPEPELELSVGPVPELEPPHPPMPEPPAEPTFEAPGAEPQAAGPSQARLDFYDSLAGDIGELTSTLSKTRGVTSIFVVERSGHMLEHSSRDEVAPERISTMIVEALDFLEAFASDPQYWVLECNGGILVMQSIDYNHVLVAIGQAGANFGALRYTMDKTRARFAELLAGLPD